jgi:hypothetical protein
VPIYFVQVYLGFIGSPRWGSYTLFGFIGVIPLFAILTSMLAQSLIDKAKIIDSIQISDNPNGIIFDPVNKLIFTANGNGSISVISQISANDYALIDNIITKKGSNSITFDETTLSLYVPGADQEIVPKTSPKQPTQTRWIPSSFQVMVLDKEKL